MKPYETAGVDYACNTLAIVSAEMLFTPHLGGHTSAHRTLAGGADIVARHLSRCRCHTQVVGGFPVQCFEALPDHLNVEPISRTQDVVIQRLEVEADEMQSFVKKKENKQWIWIAMDAKTRQVIAFHVGDRSRRSAKQLWAKIPAAYRQHATFYTDQYVVYAGVIPAAQHRAIRKLARETNHIERFNNTLRQRVSRLVREALSFSKKLAHHIGAIKLFICHYNLTRAAA
jgi:insertion element IS1 protein InsB